MQKYIKKFLHDIQNRFWLYLFSLIFLVLGLYAADLAGAYVEKFTYNCPLNDTIHNMLPLVNANIIASLFPIIFSIIIFVYVIFFNEREDLPYILFLIGLYNFVRAFFLILTQLPPPYPRIDDYPYFKFPGWYFGTRDLFPSGHTGFPFLMFLTIRNKFFKYFSLFFTITIAIGLLLMRVHYSLDIFGAIFIVYAMYSFSERYIHRYFKKR